MNTNSQCDLCKVFGNLTECKRATCHTHNTWYAKELVKENKQLHKELVEANTLRDKLVELLAELTAMVNGECPSLLDEDRGGSSYLYLGINQAIEAVTIQKQSKL